MRAISKIIPFAVLMVACVHSREPVTSRKSFSYGFQDENEVYFLLEYQVRQARPPVWFIMPIERRARVFFHKIYLYRYEPGTNRLEQLATVREEFPPRLTIRNSKFTKDGSNVVFAYQAGSEIETGILYEVRVWDTEARELREAGPEALGPVHSSLYQKYFGDYKSPLSDNPGIIGISELRRDVLAEVGEEDWDLPLEEWQR